MKKKILLAIVPALMILSSCAGVGPKKAMIQPKEEMAEDTVVHEELFGEASRPIKLTPYRDPVVPSDPSLKKPLVGVQYKDEGGGKYAVRYVAAIAALDVEATWTRSICDENGNQQQTGDQKVVNKPVTYAYTAVSADNGSGDSFTTPESVDEDFHYFVVYTLRNIPADQVDSYLCAYLTLEKGGNSIRTLACVSKVSGGNSFAFDSESITGYFLQGKIGGTGNRIVTINDTPLDTAGNYAEKENIDFNANDEFGIFKWGGDHFQFFGHGAFASGTDLVSKVNSSDYCKVTSLGTYSLYLTKTNDIHFAKCTTIYLVVGVWDAGDADERYASWVWGENASRWFDWTLSGGKYTITLDLGRYNTSHLCRMNNAVSANGWGGDGNPIWNRIDNITLPSNGATKIEYHVNGWSYGDWTTVS